MKCHYKFLRTRRLKKRRVAILVTFFLILATFGIILKIQHDNANANAYPGEPYTDKAFIEFLNSSRPRVDHTQISFLLYPHKICCKQLDFLIVVHSKICHTKRRNILRHALGRYNNRAKLKYKLLFVLGASADASELHLLEFVREQNENEDLLMVDVIDSYRHLTLKAVGWIKFVSKRCSEKTKFILKMDDDALVNLPAIIDMLEPCMRNAARPICKHISCRVRLDEPSLRNGKNYVSLSEYPLAHYPPMCPGIFVIIPSFLIGRLYEASKRVPFFWLDDVYITAVLRYYIGEKLHSLKEYYLDPYDQRYEPLYRGKLVAHLSTDSFVLDYLRIWHKMLDSYGRSRTIASYAAGGTKGNVSQINSLKVNVN
ncbi:Uncharacterised protein g790 [Pycnogonum litorale]